MAIKNQKIVADFETTTTPEDLRVWAVCAVDIGSLETVFIDNSIDSFFKWLEDKNTICYFHNLKFDGEFILSYLLSNGYTYSEEKKNKTFSTLITDMGIFYSITVIFEKQNKKYKKVTFYDSLKKLPFKVSQISEAFKLEDKKLIIDYKAYRAPGHVLTEEERDYIVNDCRIVANALQIQFGQGLTRMTNASDAFNAYKKLTPYFDKWYPVLPIELDSDIRRSYRGGFVYLRPDRANVRGLQGITLDVNSLYPSVMYNCLLPVGYPMFFEGVPEPTEYWNLFIVRIKVKFDIKKDHLPTIQIKGSFRFNPTEYLTTSKQGNDDEPVELVLTSVDLALFLDHYTIHDIKYLDGWMFHGVNGLFTEYINYWSHIKENSTGALRQLAKLMLNSLYGRFAMNPKGQKKIPMKDHDNIVRYTDDNVELRDPIYTAMGCFITAYAREKTIRSGQRVYDRFIYADTDSLHLIGCEAPEDLDIHPKKLGYWKNEGTFTDSCYIRAKTYMETMHETHERNLKTYVKILCNESIERAEHINGVIHSWETKVTCAGMPDNVKKKVTYDNFKSGSTFDGKLVPRRYPGGIILTETTFTIK